MFIFRESKQKQHLSFFKIAKYNSGVIQRRGLQIL